MTLNEYIDGLIEFRNNNPTLAEATAIYSADDEGNRHQAIYYTPSAAFAERGFTYSPDTVIQGKTSADIAENYGIPLDEVDIDEWCQVVIVNWKTWHKFKNRVTMCLVDNLANWLGLMAMLSIIIRRLVELVSVRIRRLSNNTKYMYERK